MNIDAKTITLEEQFKFIQETRRFLENHPDSEIQLGEDPNTVAILRAIEENLNTIKMWLSLPDYHQAALHLLDKAYELHNGAKMDLDDEQFFMLLGEMVEEFGREDLPSTFEAVGAVALLAVGKFVIPGARRTGDVSVMSAAEQELLDLKAWWIRLHQDVMADDFESVRRDIRRQVNSLEEDHPGILSAEDKAFFWPELKAVAKEVSHG